jgi:hypothetical protein
MKGTGSSILNQEKEEKPMKKVLKYMKGTGCSINMKALGNILLQMVLMKDHG